MAQAIQHIFIKRILFLGGILLIVSACASKKNATESSVKEISMLNYPYIEKFHEGLRLKAKGEINNAIEAFDYCLKVRQNDDAVYYALSQLYLQKKDLASSASAIQKASKIDPSNIWYTQEMAFMLFEQGKYDESLKGFEKLVKKEPGNVEWLYGYAECLVRVGKISDAIKALDKTEEQVGKHPELTLQKFQLYVKNKQPEKGIEEINKSRKDFPEDPQLIGTLIDYYFQTKQDTKAISMLEELTKADPNNGRAHLGLSDIYRQQGKKKESFEELKKGFNCEDVDIDTKMKILINIHETGAKLNPEVNELIDIMIKQYPTDSKAYSIQGDFLLGSDQTDKALSAYKLALKYDKSKYTIWNQVLIMEYQSGDYQNLFTDSKECLNLFPSVASVYLLNGVAANQLKKYDDAISGLETGKDLVINDKPLQSEFYSQLGEAYFGSKKYTEGKTNYELALSLDPLSTLNMNNFAYRLALAKIDLNRAEELIKKANLISPSQPHFLDTYGWVLFQKGDFQKAKEYFDRALVLSSSDKVIVEHVGDAFFKNGSVDKAIEYWKIAKTLGSTNKNLELKIEKKEYYEPIY
jgi:tetratricopeptide (TPR) repeat protein